MNMKYTKSVFGRALILAVGGIVLMSFPRGSQSGTSSSQKKENKLAEDTEAAKRVTLISVYDNYQVNPELKTAWGFATVVKTPEETLLFDTGGGSDILLYNMEKMNIDPRSINKIFISHVHGDHLGGLQGFLEVNHNVTVYIPASFPDYVREMISKQSAEFIDFSEPGKISDFLYSTGELYGPPKEQSLVINSKKGLIIMTGCSHPGIENIVKKFKEMFPLKKIYLAVGGFHRPPETAVKGLRTLGVEKVAPSHCTGDQVIELFRKEYGDDFLEYGVGAIIHVK